MIRALRRAGAASWGTTLLALALGLAPGEARAQTGEDAYGQHMTNGVRLFNSGDFKTAITEFEAAYESAAGPSPLINQALAYQKLSQYPKAVAKLELCLAKHGGAMSEGDRQEVKKTIDEMRPLLAFVSIETSPTDAALRLDEEPIAAREAVPLSPGEHKLVVEKPGFVTATRAFSVVSGDKLALAITLDPAIGTLIVSARDKGTAIRVDGKVLAHGAFSGELPAGEHSVELVGETGTGTVRLGAGERVTIDAGKGQTALPALPDAPAPPAEKGPVRGLYGGINGAVLFPTRHPNGFEGSASSGTNVGLRGGYRVHDYAAFEGLAEYGNVEGPANGYEDPSYSLTTIRFGPQLRLMSPGDLIHFVGTVGGGLAINIIKYEDLTGERGLCRTADPSHCKSLGADFYVMTEAGAELNFGGVLIGIMGTVYLNGTKSMDDGLDENAEAETNIQKPYGNSVLPMIGPRAFVGYAFW